MCRRPVGIRLGDPVIDPDDAFDDVVDIREVAFHLTVVEDRDRPALEDRLGENEHRHVRPPPGSIDGEEAQAEEHTSELQSLMRISYAVFCLKKKKKKIII